MSSSFNLKLHTKNSDTFVEVIPHDDEYAITGVDLENIKQCAEKMGAEVRRKVKYILLRGFRINTDESESGRHMRVSIPNRLKHITSLKKESNDGIRVKEAALSKVDDYGDKLIYPKKEDLMKSIILPVEELFKNHE